MKKLLLAIPLCCLTLGAIAQQAAQTPADAGLNDDKLFYSIGYLMGQNIKSQIILERGEDDSKAISQGMRDSLLDRNSQTDLDVYRPLIVKRYEDDAQKKLAQRKIDEAAELDAIKKQKNAKEIPGGGVIISLSSGKRGKTPKATSMVSVHYEGALLDGTVFDSSYKRGAPAQFALNAVIACWTQGLQKMRVGQKAKLFCPPAIAYGDKQAGAIPPGSTLVFDVELLEVND